jgi:hypothetical protein
MHDPATSKIWLTVFGKDFGGMAQGCKKTGQKRFHTSPTIELSRTHEWSSIFAPKKSIHIASKSRLAVTSLIIPANFHRGRQT